LILGQALLLGNIRAFAYAISAWLMTHLFVVTYEEPTLRKSFGAEYETFCAHVPRWLPRFRPWRKGTELDVMQRDGIIGPPDGSKPREVLKRPDWLREVEGQLR